MDTGVCKSLDAHLRQCHIDGMDKPHDPKSPILQVVSDPQSDTDQPLVDRCRDDESAIEAVTSLSKAKNLTPAQAVMATHLAVIVCDSVLNGRDFILWAMRGTGVCPLDPGSNNATLRHGLILYTTPTIAECRMVPDWAYQLRSALDDVERSPLGQEGPRPLHIIGTVARMIVADEIDQLIAWSTDGESQTALSYSGPGSDPMYQSRFWLLGNLHRHATQVLVDTTVCWALHDHGIHPTE